MDNLKGNLTLAKDVLTLSDLIKLDIESKLKVNMRTLDNTACYTNNDNKDIDDYSALAVALLQALTTAQYDGIRSKFINTFFKS